MTAPYGFSGEALQTALAVQEEWQRLGVRGALWARHLDTGEELGFDPDAPFALASVAKVPLALAVLDDIAAGRLAAGSTVELDPATSTPGPTGVSRFRHPSRVAVEDLVYLMLALSDNAAADALFALVPPAALTERLRSWGCPGIVVRHPMRTLYDAMAIVAPEDARLALELAVSATTEGGGHVLPSLDVGSATRGSARALVDLLAGVWDDAFADPAATATLRDLLGRQVGRHRMVAELRTDTTSVHSKTGSFLNLRHEAGVVTTSEGDRIAVAALTASTVVAAEQPEVDRAIGSAARAAVDSLRL